MPPQTPGQGRGYPTEHANTHQSQQSGNKGLHALTTRQ